MGLSDMTSPEPQPVTTSPYFMLNKVDDALARYLRRRT